MALKKGLPGKALPGKLKARRREKVDLAPGALVHEEDLFSDNPLPLLVRPAAAGVNLIEWCRANRDALGEKLRRLGAVLFRGFSLESVGDFEKLIGAVSGDLLHYSYRSTPRSEVEGKIYTSTEYPPDQVIPMHNEMSYSRSWPMKIWFYCKKNAQKGGETPIADSRKVFEGISSELREKFEKKKVMYVRNYGGGLDLSWREVFQVEERSEVEEFCRGAGIEWEWRGGDRLRTRQVCQAVARHPITGSDVWFNQAHLFHVSSLAEDLRQRLLAAVAENELPRNAYYGDGSEIEAESLEEIRRAYDRATVSFPWQEGDLLLLDNMMTAHGRKTFEGERRILVGMAEPAGETQA